MNRVNALLLVPGLIWGAPALAASCPVRGAVADWQTDLCLLQVGTDDPKSQVAQVCKRAVTPSPETCEFKVSFKQNYCQILIQRALYKDSLETCVTDGSVRGPVVRGRK